MRAPLKYVQSKNSLLLFYNEMGYMGKRWLFICSNSGYRNCHDKIEQSFAGQDDIDVVVGVGGGAAIDTAKATAYYEGKRVISVPTVVATDAPCTGLSVIYNDDGSFDQYLFYPQNPDAVIVDTQVIANAPVKFLIDGMGDALGTYFEGLASLRTESPSLEGIGITRSGMALAKCCYDTLVDY